MQDEAQNVMPQHVHIGTSQHSAQGGGQADKETTIPSTGLGEIFDPELSFGLDFGVD